MDKKELDEIKAREKATTPGQWKINHNNPWVVGAKNIVYKFLRIGEIDNANDADFIAHAHTDILTLLAEVERLTAENATLKKALTELIQTGKYNFCELCGADCIDAGLDFVDEMSQCGCFKLRDSQKAQQTHETQEEKK